MKEIWWFNYYYDNMIDYKIIFKLSNFDKIVYSFIIIKMYRFISFYNCHHQRPFP